MIDINGDDELAERIKEAVLNVKVAVIDFRGNSVCIRTFEDPEEEQAAWEMVLKDLLGEKYVG